MSVINKKRREKEVADYFKEYYNSKHDLNYKIRKDPKDEYVDYFLISKNKDKIKLQITTSEHKNIRKMVYAIKKPGKIIKGYNLENLKYIRIAIRDKNNSYPKKVQADLTLLVWNESVRFNKEYKERN